VCRVVCACCVGSNIPRLNQGGEWPTQLFPFRSFERFPHTIALRAVRRFLNTVAAPSLPQLVIAEFIGSGGYDRYLRGLRQTLSSQQQLYSQAAARYFPEGTKISRPAGGCVLWFELPKNVDALKLYRLAALQNISILPGLIFS